VKRTRPGSLVVTWIRGNTPIAFHGELVSLNVDSLKINEIVTATMVFQPYPDSGFIEALEAAMKGSPPLIKHAKQKRKTK
jgi:hypothetical protein